MLFFSAFSAVYCSPLNIFITSVLTMTARRRELCTGHVAGSWIHCASQNADCGMPEQMNPGLLPYSYHGRIQRRNWLIQMSALIVIQPRWLKNLICKCRNVRSLPGTWRDVSLSMWITQRAAVGKNWPRAQRNRTDGTTFFCCNQHSWMVVWPMHEREAIQQKADKKKKTCLLTPDWAKPQSN